MKEDAESFGYVLRNGPGVAAETQNVTRNFCQGRGWEMGQQWRREQQRANDLIR